MNLSSLGQNLQLEKILYIYKWWYNQSWKLCSLYCLWEQLESVERHQNWSDLVSLLIILIYWCQGLCLTTSYRSLIEPGGAQSFSELALNSKISQWTLNSKMLASLKQYTFYPPAWVSYCIVKSSRGPLWRLACAPCSRWLNKLWLLFSPLPEYLLCQKEGCMKLKIWMLFPWHETAKWFQKKYHSLCLKLWKYLCLNLKMAFPRVAM